MKSSALGELLPQAGLEVVTQFATELKDGKHDQREYLDIHADLRTRLRPYKEYYSARGMADDDYFVLVVLRALGVKGADNYLC